MKIRKQKKQHYQRFEVVRCIGVKVLTIKTKHGGRVVKRLGFMSLARAAFREFANQLKTPLSTKKGENNVN